MSNVSVALSIKQPWATLVVHGHKSIEIRRWSTARRGRVLIHAPRVPDQRPDGWSLLPEGLRDAARLSGGIVGAAELVECRVYRSRTSFVADQDRHLNKPQWFEEPELYGFVFANPAVLRFTSYPGWVRFFRVSPDFSSHDR
jgi:hypothetical protein